MGICRDIIVTLNLQEMVVFDRLERSASVEGNSDGRNPV